MRSGTICRAINKVWIFVREISCIHIGREITDGNIKGKAFYNLQDNSVDPITSILYLTKQVKIENTNAILLCLILAKCAYSTNLLCAGIKR